MAPLSLHTTARTNGAGNSVLTAGSTIGVSGMGWVPSVRYSIGLSDDFDLGFQYEVVEWGASAKYRVLGGAEGLSLAGLGGTGLGLNGFYFFAGPVVSWKKGIFEPYFSERINYVNYPNSDVNVENGVGQIHVDPGTYVYLQHTLGFFLWPIEWVGFGAEVSGFGTLQGPFILRGRDRYIFSGQLTFKF